MKNLLPKLKTLAAQSIHRRPDNVESRLPWIAFLALPAYMVFIQFWVIFTACFMFDKENHPGVMDLLAIIGEWSLFLLMGVWPVCLVWYFLPKVGRRDIYCWVPLLVFAIHMCTAVALYAFVFLFYGVFRHK